MMSPKRENLAYPRRGPLPAPLRSTLIKRRLLLQMIWKEQNGETQQFDPILEQVSGMVTYDNGSH
jgi:hypothetical protein